MMKTFVGFHSFWSPFFRAHHSVNFTSNRPSCEHRTLQLASGGYSTIILIIVANVSTTGLKYENVVSRGWEKGSKLVTINSTHTFSNGIWSIMEFEFPKFG
jgi:hypothetical protein